jgi:ferritin heavy chain
MNSYNLILLFGAVLTIGVVTAGEVDRTCDSVSKYVDPVVEDVSWRDMQTRCINAMRNQITTEIDASNKYLQLGAYFSRETINRPGFAHFFFEAAKEEREHASKLVSYLLMRGRLSDTEESDDLTEIFKFIDEYKLEIYEEKAYSGLSALKKALKMEQSVTESIKKLIATCESEPVDKKKPPTTNNDYHLVDYLTSDFLTEQYEGERQLAGFISTLTKLMGQNKEIGEFMFDKTLLK